MVKPLVTGIDIGHHSIKAVVMKPAGEQYELVSYHELAVTDGIFAENHTLDYSKIVKKLKELKKKLPMFSKLVAISVPDNAVISKVLQIDSELDDKEKEFAIYQVFGQQSPFPVEDLSIDYVQVEQGNSTRTTSTYQVYATRKEVVESRVDAVTKSGFQPLVIDSQAHSLLRVWDLASQVYSDKQSWLLVDIGLTQTTLCIMPKDRPAYFKDLPFGTQNIIPAQPSLSFDSLDIGEAEPSDSIKLEQNQYDNDQGAIIESSVDEVFISDLAERLKRQINLYGSVNPTQPIEGVWISGGGACLSGLAEALNRELEIPISVLNPFGLLVGKGHKRNKDDFDLSAYSTATGLAIRGIQWQRGKHVA